MIEENNSYHEGRKWTRFNFKMSVGEGVLANFATGLTTPFLGVIAIGLGGPDMSVALLTALPCLVNTIAYIPAAVHIERRQKKLPLNLKFSLIARFFYLLMAILPFLSWGNKATMFISLVALQALPTVFLTVSWTAMINNMFPSDDRARIINARSMYCAVASLVGTVLTGLILDYFADPWKYFIVFFMSYVSTMCSIYFLTKQKEIIVEREPQPDISIAKRLKGPFSDAERGRKFKRYMISAFVLSLGVYFAVPLFPIFHVRTLGLSNSVIGSFNVLAGITAALSYSLWGKIIRMYGNSMVYMLSGVAFAVYPIFYYFGGMSSWNNALVLMILQFLIGMFNAGWNMSLLNLTLDYVDPDKAENGIAVFNTMLNVSGTIAPILCYFILTKWGTGIPFFVSAFFRIVGCLIFIPSVDFKGIIGTARRRRDLRRRRKA